MTENSSTPPAPIRLLRSLLRPLGLETFGRVCYQRLTRPRVAAISETAKCRSRLAPYCIGCGLDIGFGNDPITDFAIRMDMPQPYSSTGPGKFSVQLGGDAANLHWFREGALDFIYSSHVLEDFVDVDAVLREWLRVLRPGGRLIIYCPDEQVYRRHCATTGQPYNEHHVHADFSLAFVQRAFARVGGSREIHSAPLVEIYSWEVVVEKI